jgi:hypothetical protein
VAHRCKCEVNNPSWYLDGESPKEDTDRLRQLNQVIKCLNGREQYDAAVPYKRVRVTLSDRVDARQHQTSVALQEQGAAGVNESETE